MPTAIEQRQRYSRLPQPRIAPNHLSSAGHPQRISGRQRNRGAGRISIFIDIDHAAVFRETQAFCRCEMIRLFA